MAPDGYFPRIDEKLEEEVRTIGNRLFDAMEARPAPGILSKKGAYGRLMQWTLEDPAFKAQLFRFVDVLPSLRSPGEVVRHLREYLGDKAVELSPAMKAGLAASHLAPGLVAGPVQANVRAMAGQFVAGETPADLVERVQKNAAIGMATTIDLLGETVVSEAEADAFLARNIEVLEIVSQGLSPTAPGNNPLVQVNLSIKISALTPDLPPADPLHAIGSLRKRLLPVLRKAVALGAFINFDMESYRFKDLTLALFRSILGEPEFSERPAIGIALQAYLRDSERDLRELIDWARRRRRPITVRLVKGAYWDYETILAAQRNWPSPVWAEKAETDANFEKLTTLLLDHLQEGSVSGRAAPPVTPAFATHNVRSCAFAIATAQRLGIDPGAYEFQALYGMADELKRALISAGQRVREYCPVGELLPGMAYLVRRLLENTSNEGFLKARSSGTVSREDLLKNPNERTAQMPSLQANASMEGRVEYNRHRPGEGGPRASFRNAPNTDFTQSDPRQRMHDALAKFKAGRRAHPVINGRGVPGRTLVPSANPSRPSEILGHWGGATTEDASAAIEFARRAQPAWAARPAGERADLLERAADLLEKRRFELNALEILEAGKPWIEADADVSEAIDFCRFYAVEARRLGQPSITQAVPGERCSQIWIPRGVGVAIAPWNFPLAILCSLTAAPLAAGNAVIMKPAEQTSLIAAALMDVLLEAGIPPAVIAFLPGKGEEVGSHLVSHPGIDFVAFTGSRAVGLNIQEVAGRTPASQHSLKKVVCEMGGKNALIVDNDADLDEAIPAAIYSAFGFSGQKCSALSRLILLDGIHDDFLGRFLGACASLTIGPASAPSTVVGPVIDAEAQTRINGFIERGNPGSRLAYQARLAPALVESGGFFVPPTVFADVRPDSVIAREEIFGPVLAVIRAANLDEAFAIANDSAYALTGGLFSRSPSALARAERELAVGNLYLNRGITGAIVERHPFGGYRLSGGGTKAGGREYLENFLVPRVIAENVMRRGFTPPPVAGE